MDDLILGILGSLIATAIILIVTILVPYITNIILYKGIKVNGEWDIIEQRNNKNQSVGRITLNQKGQNISGCSVRKKTRDGKKSERKFQYKGTISGSQITLIFEDHNGVGFDSGSYVFTVMNDRQTLEGMATFHGKKENKIISESRTLKKVPNSS